MHLLLVEDDHLVAQGLIRSLRQEGYSVEHSGTVKHALECLSSGEIELVILDLGLPDGDGSQVLKHIKAQKKVIPVVILTARGSIDDKVQGLDMGADDYLAKPFDPAELFARLRVASRRINQTQSSLLRCGDVVMDTSAHTVAAKWAITYTTTKRIHAFKSADGKSGKGAIKTTTRKQTLPMG